MSQQDEGRPLDGGAVSQAMESLLSSSEVERIRRENEEVVAALDDEDILAFQAKYAHLARLLGASTDSTGGGGEDVKVDFFSNPPPATHKGADEKVDFSAPLDFSAPPKSDEEEEEVKASTSTAQQPAPHLDTLYFDAAGNAFVSASQSSGSFSLVELLRRTRSRGRVEREHGMRTLGVVLHRLCSSNFSCSVENGGVVGDQPVEVNGTDELTGGKSEPTEVPEQHTVVTRDTYKHVRSSPQENSQEPEKPSSSGESQPMQQLEDEDRLARRMTRLKRSREARSRRMTRRAKPPSSRTNPSTGRSNASTGRTKPSTGSMLPVRDTNNGNPTLPTKRIGPAGPSTANSAFNVSASTTSTPITRSNITSTLMRQYAGRREIRQMVRPSLLGRREVPLCCHSARACYLHLLNHGLFLVVRVALNVPPSTQYAASLQAAMRLLNEFLSASAVLGRNRTQPGSDTLTWAQKASLLHAPLRQRMMWRVQAAHFAVDQGAFFMNSYAAWAPGNRLLARLARVMQLPSHGAAVRMEQRPSRTSLAEDTDKALSADSAAVECERRYAQVTMARDLAVVRQSKPTRKPASSQPQPRKRRGMRKTRPAPETGSLRGKQGVRCRHGRWSETVICAAYTTAEELKQSYVDGMVPLLGSGAAERLGAVWSVMHTSLQQQPQRQPLSAEVEHMVRGLLLCQIPSAWLTLSRHSWYGAAVVWRALFGCPGCQGDCAVLWADIIAFVAQTERQWTASPEEWRRLCAPMWLLADHMTVFVRCFVPELRGCVLTEECCALLTRTLANTPDDGDGVICVVRDLVQLIGEENGRERLVESKQSSQAPPSTSLLSRDAMSVKDVVVMMQNMRWNEMKLKDLSTLAAASRVLEDAVKHDSDTTRDGGDAGSPSAVLSLLAATRGLTDHYLICAYEGGCTDRDAATRRGNDTDASGQGHVKGKHIVRQPGIDSNTRCQGIVEAANQPESMGNVSTNISFGVSNALLKRALDGGVRGEAAACLYVRLISAGLCLLQRWLSLPTNTNISASTRHEFKQLALIVLPILARHSSVGWRKVGGACAIQRAACALVPGAQFWRALSQMLLFDPCMTVAADGAQSQPLIEGSSDSRLPWLRHVLGYAIQQPRLNPSAHVHAALRRPLRLPQLHAHDSPLCAVLTPGYLRGWVQSCAAMHGHSASAVSAVLRHAVSLWAALLLPCLEPTMTALLPRTDQDADGKADRNSEVREDRNTRRPADTDNDKNARRVTGPGGCGSVGVTGPGGSGSGNAPSVKPASGSGATAVSHGSGIGDAITTGGSTTKTPSSGSTSSVDCKGHATDTRPAHSSSRKDGISPGIVDGLRPVGRVLPYNLVYAPSTARHAVLPITRWLQNNGLTAAPAHNRTHHHHHRHHPDNLSEGPARVGVAGEVGVCRTALACSVRPAGQVYSEIPTQPHASRAAVVQFVLATLSSSGGDAECAVNRFFARVVRPVHQYLCVLYVAAAGLSHDDPAYPHTSRALRNLPLLNRPDALTYLSRLLQGGVGASLLCRRWKAFSGGYGGPEVVDNSHASLRVRALGVGDYSFPCFLHVESHVYTQLFASQLCLQPAAPPSTLAPPMPETGTLAEEESGVLHRMLEDFIYATQGRSVGRFNLLFLPMCRAGTLSGQALSKLLRKLRSQYPRTCTLAPPGLTQCSAVLGRLRRDRRAVRDDGGGGGGGGGKCAESRCTPSQGTDLSQDHSPGPGDAPDTLPPTTPPPETKQDRCASKQDRLVSLCHSQPPRHLPQWNTAVSGQMPDATVVQHATELLLSCVNDWMDAVDEKGVCGGPETQPSRPSQRKGEDHPSSPGQRLTSVDTDSFLALMDCYLNDMSGREGYKPMVLCLCVALIGVHACAHGYCTCTHPPTGSQPVRTLFWAFEEEENGDGDVSDSAGNAVNGAFQLHDCSDVDLVTRLVCTGQQCRAHSDQGRASQGHGGHNSGGQRGCERMGEQGEEGERIQGCGNAEKGDGGEVGGDGREGRHGDNVLLCLSSLLAQSLCMLSQA